MTRRGRATSRDGSPASTWGCLHSRRAVYPALTERATVGRPWSLREGGVSVSVAESTGSSIGHPPAYEDVLRAFQEVGEALVSQVERDPLLHVVLHKVCDLVGVRRGSLYLLDDDSGLFHGQVGFAAETAVDEDVKHYKCGVPADRFTHEILATRAPVLIADAPRDPRPIRAIVRQWNIRSILGVPMIVADEIRGLMFLDDIERPHDFTPAQQTLASAFA